jgi:transcriptional regulator with XRE-family HTH domain
MAGIGARLHMIRRQWHLSLREVEGRSRRIAQERDDSSYQLSASWLSRLEQYEHGFTTNKLRALAEIYSVPIDQLLATVYPKKCGNAEPRSTIQPEPTELPTEALPKAPAKGLRSARLVPDLSIDETTLLPTEKGTSRTPYLRGIIGKLDLTLNPMIPAGSLVQIDTRKREIAAKKEWTHEYQRPIYFLKTKDGYVCGWCELDEDSQWLTLIPHSLSPASSRRWSYRTEVENLGRVMSVVIRLG